MVALDLDGTLYDDRGTDPSARDEISPAVRTAVKAVIDSGTHVVLCTGRTGLATMPFLRDLHVGGGFAVCSNGAVLIEAGTGRIVEQISFELREVIPILSARLPAAIFVAEIPGIGARATGGVDDADTRYGDVEMVDVEDLARTATTRLAVHWPERTGAALAEALRVTTLPGVGHCCYGDEPLADIMAAGVSKGAMLERVRIGLGVAATETVAIGDGINDVEMLTWAAHGVAMKGSPQSVLAVADQVCPSVADDGVADVLAQWFQ